MSVKVRLLRYFLFVGALLLVLLYGWSEYLQPAGTTPQALLPIAAKAVAFRPTPAPPVAEPEQPPSSPPVMSTRLDESGAAAKPRKGRSRLAHRRAAHRSFAYVPSRRSQPFFGNWR